MQRAASTKLRDSSDLQSVAEFVVVVAVAVVEFNLDAAFCGYATA